MGATATRRRTPATARPGAAGRRRLLRRRRGLLGVVLLVATGAAVLALGATGFFSHAVREISLPLRHEDIIRQQAAAKRLDPALVAGVIFAESKFVDQTSPAGARGLMQITPDTARYIAHRSGGTAFRLADLGTPQVNIAYGTYYLHYLLTRYGGNEVLAVAAYNAGAGNVDRWLRDAATSGRAFRADKIPFPETRHYVAKVLHARDGYRRSYARELGL